MLTRNTRWSLIWGGWTTYVLAPCFTWTGPNVFSSMAFMLFFTCLNLLLTCSSWMPEQLWVKLTSSGNPSSFMVFVSFKQDPFQIPAAPRSYTPQYHKSKDEGWFLILGNLSTRDVIALKRVSRVDRTTTANLVSFWLSFTLHSAFRVRCRCPIAQGSVPYAYGRQQAANKPNQTATILFFRGRKLHHSYGIA